MGVVDKKKKKIAHPQHPLQVNWKGGALPCAVAGGLVPNKLHANLIFRKCSAIQLFLLVPRNSVVNSFVEKLLVHLLPEATISQGQ